MEKIIIEKDISVLYVPATSFPDGIIEAHKKLHNLLSFSQGREYFGLSRPENGLIRYKAAAEELKDSEGESLHCGTLIIKKGDYISITVHDYLQDPGRIKKTFEQLLTYPNLDPQGFCVEWYFNEKDVKCMIRLA